MITLIVFLIGAYLLGSISSAVVICRMAGLGDPRTQGSGNPGTTNVLRLGGKKLAIFTLLGDMLKGFLPVYLAHFTALSASSLSYVALAAFVGHLFPLFFGFKGGKGVATALGVVLALAWPVGCAALLTWIIVAALFRYSSLAALVTAVLLPFYIYLGSNPAYLPAMILLSLLLIVKHHDNIKRLCSGKESKIKF
ncbi:MAG: glycerol-3-phosphate 1-O-acyltransferase PlsY [Gammaproteobacteria bacterium]|nr:glycerol-3-phosphate 1-O-acyltransferase PlsY [Gammaproteobacteria bacterium]